MSDKINKKQSAVKQKYKSFAEKRGPKRPVIINCLKAFAVGGLFSVIGQFIKWLFMTYYNFNEVGAADPTVATMIILGVLLTGLGIYDHIAQFAGAGSIIPVTGFANAMASAAIEHRSEGYVLGVGGNMFKIAGPVITFGVFSAFVIALIRITAEKLGAL